MITYFKFSNFYSYLDENEVSFVLGKQPTPSDYDFVIKTTQDEYRLNKIMAVVGANGSGKTQLLKPLSFLKFFICSSHARIDINEDIPFQQFATSESNYSKFEIGFLIKNAEEEYEEYKYSLTLSKDSVYEESLYKKTSRLFSYVFVRNYNANKLTYKHRNFVSKSLADDTPKNVSLISYAHHLDNDLATAIADMFSQCKSNVTSSGRFSNSNYSIIEITELFHKDEQLKSTAEKLLCDFDTGISRIEFDKVLMVNEEDKKSKEILLPFGIHESNGKEFKLIFYEESNGTQSAYSLLGLILPVLHKGGVAVIDELDNDLHPHLLPAIFDLFRSSHYNPNNAQLIFSCHTPEVFNLLNKHQVYLVEKYDQVSEAWRLDEVEGVRNDENLYAKYMAGAFDAVPNL